MPGSGEPARRKCAEPGCSSPVIKARHGLAKYCLEHSIRQGTTLTVNDRAAKRPRLPDCDSTWSGHPLTRLEAQRIRAELTRQLLTISLQWETGLAADSRALAGSR